MAVSPFKEIKSNIIELENKELVQHLNSLQEGKEAIIGMAPEFSIRQTVQQNPNKFVSNMMPFLELKPRYIYDLFVGLKV